ncbi:MAG TPA: ABC transporter permease [Anaerolineales bacterium]|nr:ABC transporter permease [Anaerolineales bacterium]
MIRPFLAVVKKEIGSVLRDRTIIISILIQLFIASFSSGLLLGMLSLYDADTILRFSGAGIRIGVVGDAEAPLASLLTERGLSIRAFPTLVEAQSAFYNGDVLALVDTPQDVNGLVEIKLYLLDSDTVSSLIRMVIQEPLKQYENTLRAERGIEVRYTDLNGKPATSFEFVYSVLIPMLMFFPAFVAGSMSIDMITEEVENKTLQTLLSAPLTISGMIGAKITSAVVLAIMQCAAWLTLLQLNDIDIQNKAWILVLALVVAGITSTSAAITAAFLQDRERSQFIYSLLLLAGVSISTMLNLSPITTISRLAVGDAYTSGWQVMIFAAFFMGLFLLLLNTARRLMR